MYITLFTVTQVISRNAIYYILPISNIFKTFRNYKNIEY